MCYVCDSVTPRCPAAVAPDKNAFFMCGACEEYVIDEEDFPDVYLVSTKSKSIGTQTGLGLPEIDVERPRAVTQNRTVCPGTTSPNRKISVKPDFL